MHWPTISAVVLLLIVSLAVVSAQEDQVVTKVYPANVTCNRNATLRRMERDEIESRTGRTTLYRACYKYVIVQDEFGESHCQLIVTSFSEIINEIQIFAINENSSLLFIETPFGFDGKYFNDTVCFFIIGNKRAGFIYQYYEGIEQDVQGELNITEEIINNNAIQRVSHGMCQDFFEFREKSVGNPNNVLVTCGNETDPRIQLEVDIADALTLVFMSDGSKEGRGVNLTVFEINGTAATEYNSGSSRKKRSEILAPPGLDGLPGPTGIRGAPGSEGKRGNVGRAGDPGGKGERGVTGVKGPDGPPGTIPGNQGQAGIQGPVGPKGMPCFCAALHNCYPGQKGNNGFTGPIGHRGFAGATGPRGLPGKPGARGMPGSTGRKGRKGYKGFDGLDGPPGDQGPPGYRGQLGKPGPPGLGGCPLPKHESVTRRMAELGYITVITEEIYNGESDKKYKESVRRFHNHLVNEYMEHKEESLKRTTQTNSKELHDRSSRQVEPDEDDDCGGVLVLSGSQGEPGIAGLPGSPGQSGTPGRPGVDGTRGTAGDPGDPGAEGPIGRVGIRGPPGERGKEGEIGVQGITGHCHCYKYESNVHHTPITYLPPTKRQTFQPIGFGLKGQQGNPGSRGPRGPPGYRGGVGSPGAPGQTGPPGYRGADGVTGRTGPTGSSGPKGYPGQRGFPGKNGPPGPPGPPGCACNNVKIFQDRYGFLRAPSLIPPEKQEEGDEIEDDELTVIRVNVTCVRADGPPIIGLKGDPGLPGFPGPRGLSGKAGVDGRNGFNGAKGRKGDRGYDGPPGAIGIQGPPGKQGNSGIPGPVGQQGDSADCVLNSHENSYLSTKVATACPQGCPNGAKGIEGKNGQIGPRGHPGKTGPTGYNGPRGPRGKTGLPGSPGDEGIAGNPGTRGPRGNRGLPGAPGPAGPEGPAGPSDTCPEFDGVDFEVFYSPTTEQRNSMRRILMTGDSELASEMTQSTYPVLRELSNFVARGNRLPAPPPPICIEIVETSVNKDSVSITFQGTGPFGCQLDSQLPTLCTSPVRYDGLFVGSHAVTVSGAGNTCTQTAHFSITFKPEPCIKIAQQKVNGDRVTVYFTGEAPFTCQVGNGQALPCTSPHTFTKLPEGRNTLTISGSDPKGNCIRNRRFDVIIKELPCFSLNSYRVVNNQLYVSFISTNDLYCQYDNTLAQSCTSPWVIPRVTIGQHRVIFRDRATNGNRCYRLYHIDIKSQLDISTPVVTCGEVTVQFMANGDTQCQLDSGSFIDCTSPYHHSGLGGGQHVITVRISDGQGGYKHESVSFHISDPIQLHINSPLVTDNLVQLYFTSSAPTQCRLNQYHYAPCQSPYKQSNLKPGQHTITIRATDKAGCQQEDSVTFYIADSRPPRITITGAQRVHNCLEFRYSLSQPAVTDCSIDNRPWTRCTSPLSLCQLKRGTHYVSIRATNRSSKQTTLKFRFTLH